MLRAAEGHDPYAALRIPNFRYLVSANLLAGLAQAMLSVIVGWEIYERTDSAFALGMVGLVQIIPNILLVVPAGQIVDRGDPKKIVVAALALVSIAAYVLTWLTFVEGPLWAFYVALFAVGVGRAFRSPTHGILLASILPGEVFGNAAAWNSSSWQLASIVGPALGGFGVALSGEAGPVFLIGATMLALAAAGMSKLRPREVERSREPMTKESLLAGMRFLRRTKVLLAAITLDMVAVLLGGVTALLPIFADRLDVGAMGLGFMRAAPAVGAILMSLAIARKGPFEFAGPSLLIAVAGFGLGTIVFGFSGVFAVSLLSLAFIGACDAISVNIRDTMELVFTPDVMRGRVGSVHYFFIGMSNEFGEFESGVAAALFGVVAAVVLGGFGTLAVVATIAWFFPEVRKLRHIQESSG